MGLALGDVEHVDLEAVGAGQQEGAHLAEEVEKGRRAGAVSPITLHGLRHTHATLLLAAGVNPRVVSERLGHSSVAFTLDVYGHVLDGQQADAAAAAAALVASARRPAVGGL